MKAITKRITTAFLARQSARSGNTSTDGQALYLHGNKIAEWRKDGLWITHAGWHSNTTKERLNALPGVSISQRNYEWFLNGVEWTGAWTAI